MCAHELHISPDKTALDIFNLDAPSVAGYLIISTLVYTSTVTLVFAYFLLGLKHFCLIVNLFVISVLYTGLLLLVLVSSLCSLLLFPLNTWNTLSLLVLNISLCECCCGFYPFWKNVLTVGSSCFLFKTQLFPHESINLILKINKPIVNN